MVSPYIKANTVDHTIYDHSSIPASIERIFGLEPLTLRDAQANDVLHLLTLSGPRENAPETLCGITTEIRKECKQMAVTAAGE